MVGLVIAALMVAGGVMGIIQQVQREMEKSRAKGSRVGSTRAVRNPARYRTLTGRNFTRR